MNAVLNKIKKGRFFAYILAVLWLALLTFSYLRNSRITDDNIYLLALNEARSHFNKDVLYRRWASMEGGIYVPVSSYTPPNPFLKVLHKNVETKDGQKLTLVNPAYMTRLVHELEFKGDHVRSHITSLKPIRPENKADDWEKNALLLFENGNKEKHSLIQENGNTILRFIAPLVTEKECLKCHDVQGYKVGDIRGGISISIPYSHYLLIADSQKRNDLVFHLIIAMIGLVGLFVLTSSSEKHKRELTDEKNKLHESEERLQLFSAVIKEGIIIHDQSIILEINAAFTKITGYSREEVIGKSLFQSFIYPDDTPIVNEKLLYRFSEPYEVRALRKDGTIIPVELHGFNTQHGEKTIRVVSIRDISRRKLLEDNLKESEEKWRSIVKTSPDGIVITTLDGIINQASDKKLEMYGYESQAEVIGKQIMEFIDSEYHQKATESIGKLLNGNYIGKNEYLAIRKDNSRFYIEVNASILHDKNGTPTNFIFIERDITERKRTNERLKSSEENFRTFFSTVDDIIIIGDQQGQIIYSNDATKKKLGYSSEELSEMHVLDVHHASMRKEAEQIFSDMFAGKRNICPLPLGRKDGSLLPVETRIWFGKWDGKDCIFGISKDLSREQEALQKFNRVFEHSPALMVISSLPDRRFTEVNLTFLERLGYTNEEVIGKTSDELHLFVNPEEHNLITKELLNNGRIANRELSIKAKNGEIICGLFSGEIIENQGKKYFLTLMKDITLRKQAEKALEAERQRLASIIEGTHAGTWEWNVQTGETVFNETWAQIVGYTLSELEPISIKTWEKLSHPDDLMNSEGLLENHFKGELPYYDFECRMKHKNGEWIWVHDRGRVISWTDDGKPLMMYGTHTDITIRKQIEERLRESEEQVRQIIENSPIGIFFYNNKGQILVCNSALCTTMGSPKEKLIGLDLKKLPNNEISKSIIKTLSGENAYFEDLYTTVISGKSLFLRGLFTPVLDVNKSVIGGIAIVEDFTARKNMEEKIKEYARKLEITNTDLTNSKSEIENTLAEKNKLVEELTKAKLVLEKTNSEKDKFFSIIAHDLRSPFQSFIVLTEDIASNINDFTLQELSEFMGEINAKANNLYMLLKNLLEWSKMQRGDFLFVPKEIDLCDLSNRIIDSVKSTFEKKGVNLANNIVHGVKVFADVNMINSVLTNLLTNALKFTRKDGVVAVSSKEIENNMIEISVSDSGIGMPEKILNNLFKIQQKVGRLGTDGEESSGLGLLLCKEFVEKHNGRIWAESIEGKGSKFIFILRRC